MEMKGWAIISGHVGSSAFAAASPSLFLLSAIAVVASLLTRRAAN